MAKYYLPAVRERCNLAVEMLSKINAPAAKSLGQDTDAMLEEVEQLRGIDESLRATITNWEETSAVQSTAIRAADRRIKELQAKLLDRSTEIDRLEGQADG